MLIYFSHPTFTFNTETEKKCMAIIEEYLEPLEIINPSDFGMKHDLKSELKRADAIVAMAISGCFTYLVWKELEMVCGDDTKTYTFMVKNKNDIGPLVEGIPEDIKKLSKKESKKLSYEVTKEDYRDGLFTSLIGSHRRRF